MMVFLVFGDTQKYIQIPMYAILSYCPNCPSPDSSENPFEVFTEKDCSE